jgi:replicative DNA helicase
MNHSQKKVMNQQIETNTERRILGILLSDIVPDMAPILGKLQEAYFTGLRVDVFRAVQANYAQGRPINIVTVGKTLGEMKSKAMSEMVECTEGVYHANNWRAYIDDLRQLRIDRGIAEIKARLQTDFDIETAFKAVQELHAESIDIQASQIHPVLVDYMIGLEAQISGRVKVDLSPTFIRPLDRIVSGFKTGELIYLGGRPGMGKTLLAMQIALNQAMNDIPVAVFSIEMSMDQLLSRVTANLSLVEGEYFLDPRNRISQESFQRIGIEIDILKNRPLYVIDFPEGNLAKMESEIIRMKQSHQIKGIFVDYLQLIKALPEDKLKPKVEQITNISKAMKAMARRHEIWIVAVTSLSRQTEQRGDHRPLLSDLRESGQLEFDADKVIFVHRPAEYLKGDERTREINHLEIITRKNRNGSQGTAHAKILLQYSKITEFQPGEISFDK